MACVPLVLAACTGSDEVNPKPGLVAGLPPGVAKVTGKCGGKIALTPTSTSNDESYLSYPAVYDCATGKFEVLEPAGAAADDQEYFADLNLTASGYYMNRYMRIGRQRFGGYWFYTLTGKLVSGFERPDLDPHDLMVGKDSILYIKYITPRSVAMDGFRCGVYPIELELVEESSAGQVTWRWESTGRFDTSWSVIHPSLDELKRPSGWKGAFETVRNCYTAMLKRAFSIETPSGLIGAQDFPLFAVHVNDYIHANSIAAVGPGKDILVSGRHLDTVFLIDRKTGAVKWSLGGPKSRMSPRRPQADPRGGFSHQHAASISGNRLYVFDNGNNFPDLPSRAVIYAVDETRLDSAVFSFEFMEPNRFRRPSAGSVQPIGGGRILIGWGGVSGEQSDQTTRAVSIVDTNTGDETFAIDFAPGWESYRARYFP